VEENMFSLARNNRVDAAREQRPAEPTHRDGPAAPIELVLIGHVGFATDRTPYGTTTYTGGSGFAVAFAASALLDRGVGLVAQVGQDLDLADLKLLPIDMLGVAVRPGTSATFFINQFRDGSLSFRSALGVAAEPGFDSFPTSYFRARYVHLGTAPPRQQLAWLDFLSDRGCRAQISADVFEPFVAAEPDICRQICDRADLIFLNEAEYHDLFHGRPHPSVPTILKHGPAGAEFLADGARHQVPAPLVDEVDPIGAGEILAGAFLALRARGLAEDRALSYAVAVATRSVTEFGVAGPGVTRELNRVREELGAERPPGGRAPG
jgi:sugar/nucleoside kinase (ribokinase family)